MLLILVLFFFVNCSDSNLDIPDFDGCREFKLKKQQDCIKGEDPRHFCSIIKEKLRREPIDVFSGIWSDTPHGVASLCYSIKKNGKVEISSYNAYRDGSKNDRECSKKNVYPNLKTSIRIINNRIVYTNLLKDENSKNNSTLVDLDLLPLSVMKKLLEDLKRSGTVSKLLCATESGDMYTSYGVLEFDGFTFYKTLSDQDHYVNYKVDIDLSKF